MQTSYKHEWKITTTTLASEEERILRNISCHIMEYFKYICLPHGNNMWQNISCLVMEYFAMSHV